MTKRLLFMLALSIFAASGCNLIYKQSIQQGNAIQQEDLDKLRLGMSMNQVSFLLGTPAIQDPFHHDRWDYVSSFSRRGEEAVMRKVTLFFENGALVEMVGVEGDEFIFEDEPETEAEADESPDSVAETDGTIEAVEPAGPDEAERTPLETPAADQAEFEPQATASEVDSAARAVSEAESAVITQATEPATTPAAGGTEAESGSMAGWAIQLGAFDSLENATQLRDRLVGAGYAAEIERQMSATNERYLVRQRGIESRATAERLLQDIRQELGINGFLVPRTD